MDYDTWTPLFSGIVSASIWEEPYHVRIVWITILAIKNRHGFVGVSVPGLARMANVTREECEEALNKFENKDPDSKCQENDGQRLKKVDGGWVVLGHERNQEKMRAVCVAIKNAARQKKFRDRHPDGMKPKMVKTAGETLAEKTGAMPNDA
jgi:hypothetical protein